MALPLGSGQREQPVPAPGLRRRWHNAALRIGTSTRVHAVRFDRGPGDHERVAPACHTGHDRADHSEDLHPVRDEPVSCAHCLSHPVAFADGQPYEPGRNQLILPLPGVPPPPSWPPVNPAEQPPPPDT